MLKVRLRSLAAEGGQTQELKTCLREYLLLQRATNGRSRVPKATFDQAGWHSLGDICRIRVGSVCIYLWGIQWCHLCGSPQYCLLSKANQTLGCVINRSACCAHDFIVLTSCGIKKASVVFHLTQPPSGSRRKRSQLTPIMKPKIQFLARHSKIARSDVFCWENSRSESGFTTFRCQDMTQCPEKSGQWHAR